MKKSNYPFLVEPNEFGAYYIFFPDFPTIFTGGENIEEAINNAFEALNGHLETLRKLGRSLPNPTENLHEKIQSLVIS